MATAVNDSSPLPVSASSSGPGPRPELLRVQVLLPNGSTITVPVQEGDKPVCEVKRVVSAVSNVPPLLQRVSAPEVLGVDGLAAVPRVSVSTRPARHATHPMRVQLMSEQRVAGVSAWDIQVDVKSDSVLDLKFMLAEQPAMRAAGIKPDYMRLYARREGEVARTELQDSQTLRECGALTLPAGRVVRLMFALPSGVPGHGAIHATRPTLNERPRPHLNTMADVFLEAVKLHPTKPFLGTRTYLAAEKPERGPYVFLSYAQCGVRVAHIGAGLRSLGIGRQESVGIVSVNRAEWTLTDMACCVQGFTSVPLYDTLGPDAIEFIVKHAGVRAVVASVKELKALASIRAKCPSLEFVIAMDDTVWDKAILAKTERSFYTHTLSELERTGQANLDQFPGGVSQTRPDDMHTICYTSGTTGDPKGAILLHRNLVAACAGIDERATPEEKAEAEVYFSYLPLAHIYERVCQANVVMNAGSIGFSQGDPLKLLEDVSELKPTIFPGVPRVWQRVYDRVHAQVAASGLIKSTLFSRAYQSKLAKFHQGDIDAEARLTSAVWDPLVFNKLAALFGGRVKLMVTGAAPISPKVADFMRVSFGAKLVEGYGLTETCAALTASTRDDCYYGAVGAPMDCCMVKLVSVPDMEYFDTDAPAPRGEIWVSGANIFSGYYKQPDVTAEVFETDPQGRRWFQTGDIGTWLPDGSLKIIDRKKNLFKLSQGEYLRPEYIEGVYKQTPEIGSVFVHGDSSENFLVAVVYPDPDALTAFAKQHALKGSSVAEWVRDPRVERWLHGLMDETAKREKLRGFEVVKRIYVAPADFSVENGILTPTLKLKRNVAKKHFAEEIKRMYKEGEAKVAQIAAKL